MGETDCDLGGKLGAEAGERARFLGVGLMPEEQAGLQCAEDRRLAGFIRRAQEIEARPEPAHDMAGAKPPHPLDRDMRDDHHQL